MAPDLKTSLSVISTTVSVVVVAAGALMYWSTGRESMAIDARRLVILEEQLREYKAEIAQIKTHSNEVDVTIMRASGDVNTQLAKIAGDLTATRLDVSYMRDLLNEFRVSPFAGAAQN